MVISIVKNIKHSNGIIGDLEFQWLMRKRHQHELAVGQGSGQVHGGKKECDKKQMEARMTGLGEDHLECFQGQTLESLKNITHYVPKS